MWVIGFFPFLIICAIAAWARTRRSRGPQYVLVAVGARRSWTTRPPLVNSPQDLALLRAVGAVIEVAGLGRVKALTFLGAPTMDLVLEAADPEATAQQLAPLLAAYPVSASVVGRRDDLQWHARLWRHL
jgi:hypothetical protein